MFERPSIGEESVARHYCKGHPVGPDNPRAQAIAFSSSKAKYAERVPIASLGWGTEYLYRVLSTVAMR